MWENLPLLGDHKDDEQTPQQTAQPNLYLTRDVNPDTRAKALPLAVEFKLPVETVEAELPKFEQEAAYQSFTLDDYIDKPVTMRGLTHPQEAPLYRDDAENLGAWEKLMQDVARASAAGKRTVEQKDIWWRKYTGTATAEDEARDKQLDAAAKIDAARPKHYDGWISGIPAAIVEMAPLWLDSVARAADETAMGAGIGAGATSWSGAGAALGAGAGLMAGAAWGTIKEMTEAETALAYKEFSQMRDAAGKPVDDMAARGAAALVGVANGAVEAFGGKLLAQATPIGGIVGKFSTGRIKELMQIPSARASFAAVGRTLGVGSAVGYAEEAWQEANNVILGEQLVAAFNSSIAPVVLSSTDKAIERIGQAGKMGAQAGVAFAAPQASLGAMLEASTARSLSRNATLVQEIAGLVEGSKTFQRMPQKWQEHIKAIKEEYGVAHDVTVPLQAMQTYFQEAGITAELLAKELPGTASSLEQAAKTGQDVAIPVEEFASHFARSQNFQQHVPDVRMHPQLPTDREAAEIRQHLKEMVQNVPVKSQPVFDDIRAKVAAAESPAVADFQASLHYAFYQTQADAMGIPVEELYARHQVDIERQGVTGPTTTDLVQMIQGGTVPSDSEIYGPSLQEFVRQYGDTATVREEAIARGYFDTTDPADITEAQWVQALADPSPRYAYGSEDLGKMDIRRRADSLQQQAQAMGIDLSQAPPEVVSAALGGLEQSAYHGSPHLGIEKTGFSTDKIGTGEGAQAYGWGLYFAGAREVAEWYREKLSKRPMQDLNDKMNQILVDGDPILNSYPIEMDELFADQLADGDLDLAVEHAEDRLERWKDLSTDESYPFRDYAKEKADVWERLLPKLRDGKVKSKAKGQLYKVEIPDDADMLDWDKPLSEQSEKVKKALRDNIEEARERLESWEDIWAKWESNYLQKVRAAGGDVVAVSNAIETIRFKDRYSKKAWDALRDSGVDRDDIDPNDIHDMLDDQAREETSGGEYIYNLLSDEMRSPRKASEYLHSLGIRGIRYLDGSSRSQGDGNHNYVIFDDSDIQVTDTYYQIGGRIAAALQEENGPSPDSEIALPPGVTTYYQVQNLPEWKKKTEAWMKKNGYSEKEIKRHLKAIEGQMKIFSALGPMELEMLPKGAGMAPGKGKGPIRTNADPIYKITFDLSAMCVKRLEAAATANYVQAKIGRALTTSERMALVALFRAAGKAAPCIYCYVEAPRAKGGEFVKTATEVVLGSAPKEAWSQATKAMATAAQSEAKRLGITEKDIDVNAILDPEYGQTEEARAKMMKAPDTYSFLKAQMLAAKANLPKLYEEYSGQILDLPQALLDELNGYAGLRFFSSSDFQGEHVADLMQAVNDMAVRGAKGHVYSKVPEFVEIFGGTGLKMQTSIFAKEEGGQIVEDNWQGMEWDKAQAYREQFQDVGTVLVATSDNIVQWALGQDWIDYIIPFHYSGLEKKFYGELDWEDFTSTQSEKALDKGGEANKIRQHETGSVDGVTNEQGTRRYLEIAMERRLVPVFPAFLFRDYTPGGDRAKATRSAVDRWRAMVDAGKIDFDQINPNYYKLRKDYARTDTPFNPVQPKINLEAAKGILDKYLAGETPRAQVDQQLADQLVGMIQATEGTGRDIGVEALAAVKRKAQPFDEITRLNQGEQSPRGYISMNRARNYFKITLTGRADLSTFLHESGHMFLEMMNQFASQPNAPERIVADMQIIRNWLGMKPGEAFTREHHERWAQGFEAYLMEGKAPSAELKSAFSRFKAWLTEVYKDIKALGVPLTDDVRGVMDRMLASQEAINRTAELDRLTPIFGADKMDMTEEEYAEYMLAFSTGMAEAEEGLFQRLVREMTAHRQAQHKDATRQIKAQVAKDVEGRPVYQALHYLTTGKLMDGTVPPGGILGKLDRSAIRRLIPEAKFGGMLGRISQDGGVDPSMVAHYFGFKTGDEMLRAITAAPKMAEAIKAETQERLQAIFGDSMSDPGAIARQAREALHNDRIGSMIVKELHALNKMIKRVVPVGFIRAMQIFADEQIGATEIGKLQPHIFQAAEQRYARAAFDAAAKNDWLAAADAKRQQLMNHWLYRKAVAARDEVDGIRNYLRKFERTETRKKLGLAGGHYLESVDALLSGVGLTNVTTKAQGRRNSLRAYLERMEVDGQTVAIPDSLREEAFLRNYKTMTLEEFQALRDAIKNLDHLAKKKNDIRVRGEKLHFRNVMNGIVVGITSRAKELRTMQKQNPTLLEAGMAKLRSIDANLSKVEFLIRQLDGGVAGDLHEILFAPLAAAQARKFDMVKAFNRKLYDPLRKLPKEQKKRLAAEYDFLGVKMKGHEVLAVALNMGNEGNLKKLIGGYEDRGYTEEKLQKAVDEILTAEDWALVQHIWDQVNSLWPEIARVQKEATGLEPAKVESRKIMSKHGVFDGGYYPIFYDRNRNYKAMVDAQKSNSLFENNYMSPKVGHGFTAERTAYVGPIMLSLDGLPRHINDVIHYLTHYEAVTQALKVISDQDFRVAVSQTVGAEYYAELKPWLQAIANEGRSDLVADFADRFANHLSTGLSIMTMGMSLSTGLIQILGLSSSLSELGPRYLAHGMRGMLDPEARKVAMEKSHELRHTIQTFDRDARAAYSQMLAMISGDVAGKAKYYHAQVVNFSFGLMGLVQQQVNIATWIGAYAKADAEGADNPAMAADSVMRMTQSGGGIKDLARIQRPDKPMRRLFTAYYTYFSVLYGQLKAAGQRMPAEPVVATAQMAALVLLPTLAEQLLKTGLPDDDDPLDKWLKAYASGVASFGVATLPIVRDFMQPLIGDRSYALTPGAQIIESGVAAAKAAATGNDLTEAQIKALARGFGVAAHLPANQIIKTATYFDALLDGEVEEPIRELLFGVKRK